jgi:hypothetical protein
MRAALLLSALCLAGCTAPAADQSSFDDGAVAESFRMPTDAEWEGVAAQPGSQSSEAKAPGHAGATGGGGNWRAISVRTETLTASPSNLKLPGVPEHSLPGDPAKPRELARDGVIADRFTAPNQSVAYTFEANAGELSLFELSCWGYARGWHSAARMRVVDGAGATLADLHSAGKVLYHPFLAFTAPSAGTYTLELSGEDQFFRFILVRQSSYGDRSADSSVVLGAAETVHSYLKDLHDNARFSFDLAPGEEVAIKVQGEREEARTESRAKIRERSRAASSAAAMGAMAGDMKRAADEEAMIAKEGRGAVTARMLLYPPLAIELRIDGKIVADGAPFARAKSERASRCDVRVHCPSGRDLQFAASGDVGGLFELQRRASPPKLALHGVVVGSSDETLAGVELAFLADPDGDEWARTTTDAKGAYSVSVPAGDYLVMLARPGGRTYDLRVGITEAGELNLLWPAGSK